MRPSARRCSTTCATTVDNAVFLTTDVHANLVNDARYKTLGRAGGVQTPGSRRDDRADRDRELLAARSTRTIGNPSGGALIHDFFLKPQPPNGVGMQCAATDQFSYAEVTVTKSRAEVDLLDTGRQPGARTPADRDVPGDPCSQIVIRRRLTPPGL